MKSRTESLYRRWREIAERGYGTTGATNPRTIRYVDDRVRRAKAEYEKALAFEKAGAP